MRIYQYTVRWLHMQEILAAGWNLLFTDVDAVFLTDPFKYYQQGPYDLELCSDAPYVAQDYQNSPMMVLHTAHSPGAGR